MGPLKWLLGHKLSNFSKETEEQVEMGRPSFSLLIMEDLDSLLAWDRIGGHLPLSREGTSLEITRHYLSTGLCWKLDLELLCLLFAHWQVVLLRHRSPQPPIPTSHLTSHLTYPYAMSWLEKRKGDSQKNVPFVALRCWELICCKSQWVVM